MVFTIYDIVLLISFVVFTSVFLYRKRKNLKREGLLFLYKTSLGVKIIDKIGTKYRKALNVLGYVSIVLGFLLMIGMLYFAGRIVWIYIFQSGIVKAIKVPPVLPLLPYLPQLFKISFLPPFYFIYWILILAIVAISHEFSHGIFAVSKKVKIKSTGFGFFPFFLPIFLAAFVELDEKKMVKKKISSQMTILSAGTFANAVLAILFFGILVLFFSLSFAPSGVVFDTYTYSIVGISTITSVNNVAIQNASYEQILNLANKTGYSEIEANSTKYLATESFLQSQAGGTSGGYMLLYDNAPAINANLSNIIIKVNGVAVKNEKKLATELMKYTPGQSIIITTLEQDKEKDYSITLGADPENKSIPYLGVGIIDRASTGILSNIINSFSSFKNPNIYYTSNFGAAEFIYNFLWWLVMISFSVALCNMLPVGIFDGGRFFYLAMFAVTKSEKKAAKIFKGVTYLFLFLLLVVMVFWALNMIK
ncbi:Peptidase family M50 [uncultured archaeon]|nr:Peptidase family M50 [uncultured archaeon]